MDPCDTTDTSSSRRTVSDLSDEITSKDVRYGGSGLCRRDLMSTQESLWDCQGENWLLHAQLSVPCSLLQQERRRHDRAGKKLHSRLRNWRVSGEALLVEEQTQRAKVEAELSVLRVEMQRLQVERESLRERLVALHEELLALSTQRVQQRGGRRIQRAKSAAARWKHVAQSQTAGPEMHDAEGLTQRARLQIKRE